MKSIIDQIHSSIAAALLRAQVVGQLRKNVQPDQLAQFYFAGIEGAYATAKVRKDAAAFKSNMELLGQFLDTLRN